MAPQLIATKVPFLRGELKWIALATNSFPVPFSPRIRTVVSTLQSL